MNLSDHDKRLLLRALRTYSYTTAAETRYLDEIDDLITRVRESIVPEVVSTEGYEPMLYGDRGVLRPFKEGLDLGFIEYWCESFPNDILFYARIEEVMVAL